MSHVNRSLFGVVCAIVLLTTSVQLAQAQADAESGKGVPTVMQARVPVVVGLKPKQAKAALRQAGFEPQFQMGRRASGPSQALTAYSQHPAAGQTHAVGSRVKMLIYADVPDKTRHDLADAELTQVHYSSGAPDSEEVIDPRSGSLKVTVTDLTVRAGPTRLTIRRTLQPERRTPGLLATRWRLNWEKQLLAGDQVIAVDEAAGQTLLRWDPARQQFQSPSGERAILTADSIQRIRTDGTREIFDTFGRLIEQVDVNGHRFRLTYSAAGHLSQIDGPLGISVQLVTDAAGRLHDLRSSTGLRVRYTCGSQLPEFKADDKALTLAYSYDTTGNLVRVEHPRTGSTEFGYDDKNRITSRRWADLSQEQYEYDDVRKAVRHVDPVGGITTTKWSTDFLQAEITDPLGNVSLVEFDTAGRVRSASGPTGETASISYDRLGRMTGAESSAAPGATRFEYEDDSPVPSRYHSPDGHEFQFRYDSRLNPISVGGDQDPVTVQFEYDGAGRIKNMQTSDGQRVSHTYDSRGYLASMSDAAGNTYRRENDRQGNPLREVNPLGNAIIRNYDVVGRLTGVTDSLGATTRFEYSPAGLLLGRIDPLGGQTRYDYDARGRVVAETDSEQRATRFGYDQAGRIENVTDPAGQPTRYKYDAAGNVVQERNSMGGATAWEYDSLGRLVKETDPAGRFTRFAYTPAGHLASVVELEGTPHETAVRFEYDSRRRLAAVTSRQGRVTRFEYTNRDDPAKIIPPSGPSLTLRYDEHGNLSSRELGDELLASYEYDVLGQVSRAKYATGREVSFRRDALGNLLSWEDNGGQTQTFEYDANSRPTTVTDSTGATTRYRYDLAGNLLATTDARGTMTRRSYTAAGELRQVALPNGDKVRYEYDAAGRLAKLRRPGGGESVFAYDSLGNATSRTDPLGNRKQAVYDPSGRLLRATDAKGQTTLYKYDTAGRLAEKRLDDDTAISYRYDRFGNLVEVDDGAFPVRYSYDADGNRTKIEYPAIKRTLRYEYDERGRLAQFVDSEGRKISYAYDAHGRTAAIRMPDGRGLTFVSDASDRMTSVTYPNGIKAERSYDTEGRVTELTYRDVSGETIEGWKHRYDAVGNCVGTVRNDKRTRSMKYDSSGQLIEEQDGNGDTVKYAYGPGGNRVRQETANKTILSKCDEADRLLKSGEDSFKYDANGNLTERRNAQGATSYHYDSQDQLVRVILPDGREISYGYAPTGERIWRRNASGLTHFVTDGMEVVAELNEDLTPKATYLHGPQIDQPLMVTRDGKSYCLHADRLGSICRVTDEQGAVAASMDYDAFGQMTARDGTEVSSFAFTGREYDAETELYYYRARYYDPAIGRFLTVDPVPGQQDDILSLNPYAYVKNNPVRYKDPSGMDSSFRFGNARDLALPYEFQLTDRALIRKFVRSRAILKGGKGTFFAKGMFPKFKAELARRGIEPPVTKGVTLADVRPRGSSFATDEFLAGRARGQLPTTVAKLGRWGRLKTWYAARAATNPAPWAARTAGAAAQFGKYALPSAFVAMIAGNMYADRRDGLSWSQTIWNSAKYGVGGVILGKLAGPLVMKLAAGVGTLIAGGTGAALAPVVVVTGLIGWGGYSLYGRLTTQTLRAAEPFDPNDPHGVLKEHELRLELARILHEKFPKRPPRRIVTGTRPQPVPVPRRPTVSRDAARQAAFQRAMRAFWRGFNQARARKRRSRRSHSYRLKY